MILALPTIMLVTASFLRPTVTAEAALPPIQAAASSPTDELAEQKLITDTVRRAIADRDYRALNRMENEFRRTRSRTSSGIWKLSLFHWRVLTELGPKVDSGDCNDPSTDFFQEWMAASPSEAAPYISHAAVLEAYAWCIRGGGYAGSVSREVHDQFKAKVAEASAILAVHRTTALVDPHFYAVMERLYIDQGAGKSEFMRLLDEATSREPDYHYIYFDAYRYFQPQWYGSDEEVDEIARYAAARSKRAEGLGVYARFYWHALNCGCAVEGSIDWPTMKLAMRDVMARYPSDWNAANFARLSCQMNDAKEAAAWLEHVNGDPGQAWGDKAEMLRCQSVANEAAKRVPASGR